VTVMANRSADAGSSHQERPGRCRGGTAGGGCFISSLLVCARVTDSMAQALQHGEIVWASSFSPDLGRILGIAHCVRCPAKWNVWSVTPRGVGRFSMDC
jgi:hypothetical protein